MSPDVDFDPAAYDSWEESPVCGQTLTVEVGGVTRELSCEDEPGHEPPCCGTLMWTAEPVD